MPRTAGRGPRRPRYQPPPAPPPPQPPSAGGEAAPLSPQAEAFATLFPRDRAKVECRMCHSMVFSVREHLDRDHPLIPLIHYIEQFPGAPLDGTPGPPGGPPPAGPPPRVTARVAAAHKGGRHAAETEATIGKPEDKKIYRDNVQALLADGHLPTYQVASLAYTMLLARHVRVRIETTRAKVSDEVYASDDLALLESLEKRISTELRGLEQQKDKREPEAGDPMQTIERELEQAEAWVRANIGEHMSSCPSGCGQVLTIPDVPHWAFSPTQTEQGLEYPVWSPELWKMVQTGVIRLWVMAYVLRTSPEGLRITAQRRGELWPDTIILEAEERPLRERLELDDRERPASLVPLPPPRATPPAERDGAGEVGALSSPAAELGEPGGDEGDAE